MDSVEARTERMERELEKLQAAFDGMAAAVPSAGSEAGGEDGDAASSAYAVHPLTGDRDALRSGLMWAEILGPPLCPPAAFHAALRLCLSLSINMLCCT